jgi:uncharacterized protein (DUF1697 family)
MQTYIALLRGINVGGKNILHMEDLKALLAELDLHNIKTYVQSGNVVFQSEAQDISKLGEKIGAAIEQQHGFESQVLIFESNDFGNAVAANPFPEAEYQPNTLHLTFLASEPQEPDLEAIEAVKKYSERYKLLGRVFYLYAPDGIGRSKLAASVERLLGVPVTTRNWRTVEKIADMVKVK